jgi:membrane protease YdiL (CAAX protease family)
LYQPRGRFLFLLLVISIGASYVLVEGAAPALFGARLPSTLTLSAVTFVWYVLLLALLQWPLRRRGGTLKSVMGPFPSRARAGWAVLTAIALIGISMAALWAVFLPLSYLAPGFVHTWLFEDGFVMILTSGDYYRLANVLTLAVVALLAPVVEELFFRGLLLPAWSLRFGRNWAVVLSSLIFALLHVDIVGAFVFSAVLGFTFLRTRSLWLPVMIHVAGNTLLWLVSAAATVTAGINEPGSVREFQESWWIGVAGFVVGLPLLVLMIRRMPGPVEDDR